MKISQLRRGRSLKTAVKRKRLRRKQTRYVGKALRSDIKAAPRKRHTTQPYLGSDTKLGDLLG